MQSGEEAASLTNRSADDEDPALRAAAFISSLASNEGMAGRHLALLIRVLTSWQTRKNQQVRYGLVDGASH